MRYAALTVTLMMAGAAMWMASFGGWRSSLYYEGPPLHSTPAVASAAPDAPPSSGKLVVALTLARHQRLREG
ncbi:MAG TPA: hypothetical protein VHW60_00340 [Caulobacteraceae bacterium]|jgi:hypothetical protein|nr:hypothetical protein [Caulobacteraceae bacterium]